MVFADYVADNQGTFMIADTLRKALETDKRLWPADDYGNTAAAPESAHNLAILATIIGGVRPDHLEVMRARRDFYRPDDQTVQDLANRQNGFPPAPRTSDIGDAPFVRAREPDLLGELMINDLLCSPIDGTVTHEDRAQTIMEDAWAIDPQATHAFLIRLAEDLTDLGIRPLQQAMARPQSPDSFFEGRDYNFLYNVAAYFGLSGQQAWLDALPHGTVKHPNENIQANGGFPLLYAAQEGHTDIVNALRIVDGIDVDQRDAVDGTFPLLMAAQNGHTDTVIALLKVDGINVNQQNNENGTFPLLMAAQVGHTDTVIALLKVDGINVNQQNNENGAFPLLLAAQNGHAACVAELLAARAKPVNGAVSAVGPILALILKGDLDGALLPLDGLPPALGVSPGHAPFIDKPALNGDWSDIAPSGLAPLATALATALHHEGHAGAISKARLARARSCGLSFYPGVRLVEAQIDGVKTGDPQETETVILSALIRGETALLLDGTSSRLHALKKNFVHLDANAQCYDYLKFFCQFVRAADRPYSILDSIDDLAFAAPLRPEARAALAQQVAPPRTIDRPQTAPEGTIIASQATVNYGPRVFTVTFALEASGEVHILDIESISGDLPLLAPRHHGPFRRAPQPVPPEGNETQG